MVHNYSGVFNDIQSDSGFVSGGQFNIVIPVFSEGQLTGDITGVNIGLYTQKNTLHIFSGASSTSLGMASWETDSFSDPLTSMGIRNLTRSGLVTNVTISGVGTGDIIHTITMGISNITVTWVCYTTLFVTFGTHS